MNEKMNGGISTMRGMFCRLPCQKGVIPANPLRHKALTAASFLSTHDIKNLEIVKLPTHKDNISNYRSSSIEKATDSELFRVSGFSLKTRLPSGTIYVYKRNFS